MQKQRLWAWICSKTGFQVESSEILNKIKNAHQKYSLIKKTVFSIPFATQNSMNHPKKSQNFVAFG